MANHTFCDLCSEKIVSTVSRKIVVWTGNVKTSFDSCRSCFIKHLATLPSIDDDFQKAHENPL